MQEFYFKDKNKDFAIRGVVPYNEWSYTNCYGFALAK